MSYQKQVKSGSTRKGWMNTLLGSYPVRTSHGVECLHATNASFVTLTPPRIESPTWGAMDIGSAIREGSGDFMRLDDKIALVTGAGAGIGRAIALRLANEGASVIVVDIDQATADETLSLMKNPDKSMALTCDVASSSDVAQVMGQVAQRYGRLDILVNNAGVGTVPGDAFEVHKLRRLQYLEQVGRGETPTIFPDRIIDMEDRGFWKLMEINLGGTFYFCREATRLMIAAHSTGSIVNVASTSALSGEGAVHYASAKAAMLGLTKSLARELAPRHIRVNAVCPGPTNTTRISALGAARAQALIDGTLINRLCEPEEIAATVAFLASEEGTAFTGQTLAANGGSYLL